MSAIVNYRDVLLQAASPRVGVVATNVYGYLTADSVALPATSAGVVSDFSTAAGTFKVFNGSTDVTASCAFSISSNPSSLTASINASTGVFSVTAAGAWADASRVTFLTFHAVYAGVTVEKTFTLTKAAAGTNGTNGSNGTNGQRGTVNIAATTTGTTWSNTEANAALSAAGYGSPVNRDVVTLYNTGAKYSETRFYNGSTWLTLNAYVNGNMLVSGTLSADVVDGGSLTGSSVYLHGGDFQLDGTTGACISYTFTGVGSQFVNSSNPSLVPLTATSTHNSIGATKPAIKAVAGSGGNAIETSGDISVTGNVTASTFYGALSGNASTASFATSASSASTATSATLATSAYQVNNASGASLICGTYTASMQTDGNFVIYHGGTPYWDATSDLSDVTFKTNVANTGTCGIDIVKALRVVDFEWGTNAPDTLPDGRQTGFIAQEVQQLVPAAVKDINGTLLLHKEELVPFLVKSIQELSAKVSALETRISAIGG